MAHLIRGRRHLREDRRVAERCGRDERPDLHTSRRFRQRRQHRPAFPDAASWLTWVAVHEVVSEPDAVEPVRLGLLRIRADAVVGTLAVVAAIVRQEHQETDLHRWLSTFAD